MKRRSQVVQRDLPRPYDITIPLRKDQVLSDLQKVTIVSVSNIYILWHYTYAGVGDNNYKISIIGEKL